MVSDQKLAPGSTYQTTVYIYNAYGQLSATRVYTDAIHYLETDYGYDNTGNRISVTDPLGHAVTTAYDERNKPYQITDASSNTVAYDFDGDGNTVRLTDELRHITTYAFDGFDRLEQKNFPDGSSQTWSYDPVGNTIGLLTTAGNTITQTYDVRNRMLTQSYLSSRGPATIQNTYDIMGRVLTTQENAKQLIYGYDNLGRNTSFTDQAGLHSTYSYDLAGNRTGATYPTGITVNRTYDASNRLSTLADGSAVTQATYSYDTLDRQTGVSLANGTSVGNGYDLLNRVATVGKHADGHDDAQLWLQLRQRQPGHVDRRTARYDRQRLYQSQRGQ